MAEKPGFKLWKWVNRYFSRKQSGAQNFSVVAKGEKIRKRFAKMSSIYRNISDFFESKK